MFKLGVMGGTFDPIHNGHLVAAEGARDELALDKVVFVPAGKPPHKPGHDIADPRDRYIMTGLAIASNEFFEVSSIEIERPGPSYTVDTIQSLMDRYPGAEIYFITGADAILDIITWKNFEKLLSLCFFVAASRPGYPLDKLRQKVSAFIEYPERKILSMEIPALAISSTDIRRRVLAGKTIKYLLPEPVEDYIARHKLYRR
ncbi:nicotinate-nucleotide adenylyltransferase [Pelotomaculum isophthalicicum JI]|uniref:Probable nicotinate-nucleotide adenylyltransferase n=1 Tax=Pelotomaculum isophthalicicum JI TaxID=947010 RepID=A0A9X4JU11_9FIRM|nr:nicotinate-nucleotide adenylyltransferase [Pelotomaculum isophthalicicum]MDF9408320.1 nicotinate-nucleotide adenylyltransferase [Pelotomaculum isophthalicicum JI]